MTNPPVKPPVISPALAEDLKRIKDIHNLLVDKEDVSTLSERNFVEHFLPYFLGEKVDSDEVSFGFSWAALSGRGGSEVQIVDDYGVAMYRVPSLFDTQALDVTKSKMFDVIREYEIDKAIHPAMAVNNVHNALRTEFVKIATTSPKINENRKRWIEIFKRYRTKEQLVAIFAKLNGQEHNASDIKVTQKTLSITDQGPNYDD